VARLLLQNLSKVFPASGGREVRAVDGLNLEVADGESVVLLGPSGSGKTVTLRLIAGLEQPTGGTITIGDSVVNGVPAKDRDVAMVFQSHALYPHMTALENLTFGLKVRGVARAEREQRVREVAEVLGITECLRLRPVELSGGQRQRVALGRALVRKPALFLFDEPFSNLDAPMRIQLRAEFLRLQSQLGWTSVYVTHDQTDAMALGDRVAVIQAGRIRQAGPPREVYGRPVDRFVAGFIGELPMNFVPGHLDRAQGALCFQAEGQDNEALKCELRSHRWEHLNKDTGRAVLLGVRPEHVRLMLLANAKGPFGNDWKGRIEVVQPLAAETFVQVRCGPHLLGVRSAADGNFANGDEAVMDFVADSVQLFDPCTGNAL
jgi:multiple sugar transport system ATP-binding protein